MFLFVFGASLFQVDFVQGRVRELTFLVVMFGEMTRNFFY